MDFNTVYAQKLTTADRVAALVKDDDWVDYGWAIGTPVSFDAALAKRLPELHGIKFRGGILCHVPEIFKIENQAEHFCWNSWHMGGIERKAVAAGYAYYSPLRYSELPRYYRESPDPLNIAVFVVAPMDNHGYFNLGPCASHLADAARKADKVFVEVNKNMPVCLGGYDNCLHISQVDGIIEGDNPPIDQLGGGGAPTEVDQAVARLVVDRIPNGACLQLGIGGMPNAIGAMIAQSDLKDLSVHTEMYVDAFVDMAAAGKITGRHKALDKGRQVFAFAAGTQKLYDYVDRNPDVMAAPVDYTNDVHVMAQIDNFISINNAIDMDLFGQVNAESAGIKHISGTGGQLDFAMGAYLSKGGKSFICMSSTVTGKDGTVKSRIVPTLTPGSICTDPRSCTHYIVTEYGMVCMKGLSTWQRAEAAISIAHPDFREQLIKDAEKMGIWRRSNK